MGQTKLFAIIWGVISMLIGGYLQSIGWGVLAWVFFIFTGMCVFTLFRQNKTMKKLVILEGRDMGFLFPNADIKFFFKCSSKVAAKRRYKEFKKINKNITLKEVEKSIRMRNRIDSTRKFSPLRISRGAVIVDTTKLNKKQMFRKVSRIVEKRLLLKYGRNYKRR